MAKCSGIKADGGRCGAQAMRGEEHCINHHPEYEGARRRRASKGGKTGGRGRVVATAELDRLQSLFEELSEEVRRGDMDAKTGSVVGQLLNFARACIRDRVAAREQEELIARLEALEDAAAEARTYGA